MTTTTGRPAAVLTLALALATITPPAAASEPQPLSAATSIIPTTGVSADGTTVSNPDYALEAIHGADPAVEIIRPDDASRR